LEKMQLFPLASPFLDLMSSFWHPSPGEIFWQSAKIMLWVALHTCSMSFGVI
jgi:hypothetical protein